MSTEKQRTPYDQTLCVRAYPVSMLFVNAAQETLHAEDTCRVGRTFPAHTRTQIIT